jgi:large subunit ribosomal protein L30
MIVAIRIHGLIKLKQGIVNTLDRLRMRRKYTLVLLPERPEILGMIQNVKDFIAFGTITEKNLADLIAARGKVIGDVKAKISEAQAAKIAKEVMAGKSLEELKVKPWFGLHPARGGIDTKVHYPKGVLGNHGDKLNELIERML